MLCHPTTMASRLLFPQLTHFLQRIAKNTSKRTWLAATHQYAHEMRSHERRQPCFAMGRLRLTFPECKDLLKGKTKQSTWWKTSLQSLNQGGTIGFGIAGILHRINLNATDNCPISDTIPVSYHRSKSSKTVSQVIPSDDL